ncbi:MAG: TatD family deoxyribonuclease [Planctomycetaceae bacterium]|nr:MAG: TatD family deoxyribonuclease [Planctomycetaceae bacterium]
MNNNQPTPMKLIDTHCHLTHARLGEQCRDVLIRAKSAGLVACICVGANMAESYAAMTLANHADNPIPIYFTAGIHPHEAAGVPADYLAQMESLAGDARHVAVGEIGLDYHYDFSPRDAQRRVFAEQLELAHRLGKAIVVHTREAFADTMAILRESGVDGRRVVFHSCTEPPENMRTALDFGAMISFSGIVTFKKADDLRREAAAVPDGSIMIETDSPYLSPEPVRSMKTNEPANVAYVATNLAALRNTSPEALAELTTANAVRFFGLVE